MGDRLLNRPLAVSPRQAHTLGMDGIWSSAVPLDGTWIALLMTIAAAGTGGTIVSLLRQRTPRTRIDLARASRRPAADGRADPPTRTTAS